MSLHSRLVDQTAAHGSRAQRIQRTVAEYWRGQSFPIKRASIVLPVAELEGMDARTYADAATFLADTRAALESNESANNLMLGVCERLARHPERIGAAPCLKTVADECGLVLAAMMTLPHKAVRGLVECDSQPRVPESWIPPSV